MASLRERGFRGVEAYYGGTSATIRGRSWSSSPATPGMIPTGGSDYHGTYKDGRGRSGSGATGDLRVPDEILDEMKAAR